MPFVADPIALSLSRSSLLASLQQVEESVCSTFVGRQVCWRSGKCPSKCAPFQQHSRISLGSRNGIQQTARILALCFCTRGRWPRLPFRNSKYCFDSSTSMFGCAHAIS